MGEVDEFLGATNSANIENMDEYMEESMEVIEDLRSIVDDLTASRRYVFYYDLDMGEGKVASKTYTFKKRDTVDM